jgi:DNA polymerase-3 subunit delta
MARTPSASSTAPLVLIHGDDEFAVKDRARQIYDRWCGELGGMDHEVIDAQAANSSEALKALARVRAALQTLPFFGSGKAIWMRNCNFLGEERAASAQAVTETLSELAQELKAFPWGTVRLIISAGKVDKRKTIYKTIEKLGSAEGFEAISVDNKDWVSTAEAWATRAFRDRKKEIAPDALAELVNRIGPNHRQMESEAEKLSLYAAAEPEIRLEHVQAVAARNKQARAFALGDALGDRDLPRLLRTLDEELWGMKFDSKKTEIGILYGLISKVRLMLFLKEMLREGWIKSGTDYNRFKMQLQNIPPGQFPEDKRLNPLSMHPFQVFNALPQARNYSTAELVRAMGLLLECNRRLIFSNLDESLVLQQTLVQIVRGDNQPSPQG